MAMERRREFKFVVSRAEATHLLPRLGALGAAWSPFPPRTIHSLYFDDAMKTSFRESEEGLTTRSKLRLRWYGAVAHAHTKMPPQETLEIHARPVWLELKAREGADVLKARVPFNTSDFQSSACQSSVSQSSVSQSSVSQSGGLGALVLSPFDVAALFQTQKGETPEWALKALLRRGALLPQVQIRYERSYFVEANTGLRVTVDSNLECGLAAGLRVFASSQQGLFRGAPLRADGPLVLEVKGPPQSESDIANFSQRLGLRRSRFSKYCEAMLRLGLGLVLCLLAGGVFSGASRAFAQAPVQSAECAPAVPEVFAAAKDPNAPAGVRMKARQAALAYLASARESCLSSPSGAREFLDAVGHVRRVFPEGDRLGASVFSGVFRQGVPDSLADAYAQERFGCDSAGCLASAVVSSQAPLSDSFAVAFERRLLKNKGAAHSTARSTAHSTAGSGDVESLPEGLRKALLRRSWDRALATRLCQAASERVFRQTQSKNDSRANSERAREAHLGLVALAAGSCLKASDSASGSSPRRDTVAKRLVAVLNKSLPGVASSSSSFSGGAQKQEDESSLQGMVPTDGQPRVEEAFGRLQRNGAQPRVDGFFRMLALARVRATLAQAGSLAPEAFIEDVDALVFAPRWNEATAAVCTAEHTSPTLVAFAAFSEGVFPMGKLPHVGSSAGGVPGVNTAILVRRLRDESAALALLDLRYRPLKESIHNALGPQVALLLKSAPAPKDAQARALLSSLRRSLFRLFPEAQSLSVGHSSGASLVFQTPAATIAATRVALQRFLALSKETRAARAAMCAQRERERHAHTLPWKLPAQKFFWTKEWQRFESLQQLTAALAAWDAVAYPDADLRAQVREAVEVFGVSGRVSGGALDGVLEVQSAFSRALQEGVTSTLLASVETLARVALEVSLPGAALDATALQKALPALFVWHEQVLRASNVQTLVGFWEDTHGRVEAAGGDVPLSEGEAFAQPWRAMNSGVAQGVLTFVGAKELARHVYSPGEILITDALPLDLGVTAGIVTEIPQPRLSHIDLRTRERGTPNAFVSDARARWGTLLGKRVRMTVGPSGITIEAMESTAERGGVERKGSQAKATESSVSSSVFRPPSPPFDWIPPLSLRAVDLDSPPHDTTLARVGSKAFGYANLRRTFGPNALAPKAIALPSSAYVHFVRASGLNELIDLTLRERRRLSPSELEARLALIRSTFEKAARLGLLERQPWFKGFMSDLERLKRDTLAEPKMAHDWNEQTACFRFRSSSNAEDLLGFTGAGLYGSFTGCLAPPRSGPGRNDTVARAMARAFASLWGLKAFQERELRGIPHDKVAMALLVHRNFPQAAVQGVAITPSRKAGVLLVSAAPEEASITNPDGTFEGDEMTLAFSNGCPAQVEVASCPITFLERRLRRATPLLSEQESASLLRVSTRITEVLRLTFPTAPQDDVRFDIEFKFLPPLPDSAERRLVVKQARPFLATVAQESAATSGP